MKKKIKQIIKICLFFKNPQIRFLEILKMLPQKITKLRTRGGFDFFIRPNSSDSIYLQSIAMDKEYSRYFKILPNDIVIDIGANIGAFTVPEAYNQPKATFYAIEPIQNNFNLLMKNIKINNLQNVKTLHAGISNKQDTLKFYHGKKTWFGSGSLYKTDAIEEQSSEIVDCITLADIFSKYQINYCNYLKMDCEGAEYNILFNTPDEIFTKINKMAIEFHNFEKDKNQYDLIQLLKNKGFQVTLPKKYQNKKIGLIFAIK